LNQPPDSVHLLGTDDLGRDMFVRFFYAGRISMVIALMTTFFTCLIGVILGAVSGFYGKFFDTVIMRLSEVFMSLPFLLTCIVIAAFFGSGIIVLTVALTLLGWPTICRIVRGQILALRDLEYMQACEALGISDIRRIFRHLMPNVLAYVIVYATLSMASIILTETALSFLGLGVTPPTPSWGTMINSARQTVVLMERWWFWIPPGLAIFIAVLCFNLIGDGLRDAIDPKMKR
jgi:peptide/nickel transport system permease protein